MLSRVEDVMARGYGQFCPVAKTAEVFAERWTPLIVRELLQRGGLRFTEIREGIPQISRALLAQRLEALQRDGLVERSPAPGRGWIYRATDAGEEFGPVIELFGRWGQRWRTKDLAVADVDLDLLMAKIGDHLQTGNLPNRRVVIEFQFTGVNRRWWLLVQRPDVELCRDNTGLEPDVFVVSDPVTLAQVYLGHLRAETTLAAGTLQVHGPAGLVRSFPRWMARSGFAAYARETDSAPA